MSDDEEILERVEIEDDDDDGIAYEAVEVESDIEEDIADDEEEDLETALRLVREKATEEAKKDSQTTGPSIQKRPEVIDDFIRNFFLKMGLKKSMDAFQAEWYEKMQKGELRAEDVGTVPDVYKRNQELDNVVKSLQMELDKAKEIAFKARSTWDKFRKERDFHRMHHRRVAQEKNSLIKDLKRMREHVQSYEPTLAQLEHKYQLAMKEKAIAKMQQDRLQLRVETLETQVRQMQMSSQGGGGAASSYAASIAPSQIGGIGRDAAGGGAGGGLKAGELRHSRLEAAAKSRSGSKSVTGPNSTLPGSKAKSPPVASASVAGGKESRLPDEDRPNPFLSMTFEPTGVDKFTLRKTFPGHIGPISSMAMHPKKSIVATASDDSTWKMWALPSGDLIMSGDGHKDWVGGLDFHPQGSLLATASGDGTVKLWDFARAKCSHTFTDHAQAVWACAFHDQGDFVVSSSMDHTAKLWDINALKCRITLRGHVDSVNHVIFQPFSNNICTCSGDKTVSMWDTRGGLCIQTFYGHLNSCNHVAFNLVGDTIASTDADGGVRLWDVRMVQERCEIQAGPHAANKCAFDRSGQVLAVASDDGEIKIFNTNDGALLGCLSGHEDSVQSILLDKNGKFMLSAGSDHTFRIWS